MDIHFHQKFKKKYKKFQKTLQEKVDERLFLFESDSFHPLLNNHPLHGKYDGYQSINITGDIRAIYKQKGDTIIFADIGTHSELYG